MVNTTQVLAQRIDSLRESVALFGCLAKADPYHDKFGRFSSSPGMGIVYSDKQMYGGGKKVPWSGRQPNPTANWAKHFAAYVYLSHLAKTAEDPAKAKRAHTELAHASDKMQYWASRPDYDVQLATRLASQIKAKIREGHVPKVFEK